MYNVELAAEVDGRPLAAIAGGGFRAMPAAPRPGGDANRRNAPVCFVWRCQVLHV